MKFAPVVVAVVLGAALAVATPEPAAAEPCLELPAVPDVQYRHVPTGDAAHFVIADLCYDLAPVLTPLDNPDGMTFTVVADGSPTAGVTVTRPAGFTGEAPTRVQLDFGGTTQIYRLTAWFGPAVTWGTPPDHLPLPAPGTGQVELPVPGYAIPAEVGHYVGKFSLTPIPGHTAKVQAPGTASQAGGLELIPWPTEPFEFHLRVEVVSEYYGSLGTHTWVFRFGDPPPRLADTGSEPSPIAAVLALGAILVGIALFLVRRRTPSSHARRRPR